MIRPAGTFDDLIAVRRRYLLARAKARIERPFEFLQGDDALAECCRPVLKLTNAHAHGVEYTERLRTSHA
jgi:hypothetical protein